MDPCSQWTSATFEPLDRPTVLQERDRDRESERLNSEDTYHDNSIQLDSIKDHIVHLRRAWYIRRQCPKRARDQGRVSGPAMPNLGAPKVPRCGLSVNIVHRCSIYCPNRELTAVYETRRAGRVRKAVAELDTHTSSILAQVHKKYNIHTTESVSIAPTP